MAANVVPTKPFVRVFFVRLCSDCPWSGRHTTRPDVFVWVCKHTNFVAKGGPPLALDFRIPEFCPMPEVPLPTEYNENA